MINTQLIAHLMWVINVTITLGQHWRTGKLLGINVIGDEEMGGLKRFFKRWSLKYSSI